MLVETDDFNPRFEPCPPELMKSTARAQLIVLAACGHQRKGLPPDEEIVHHLIDASVYLFIVGLQFYGMSGWLCSDYIPVYRLSGDSFKTAADGFALSPETRLLAVYSYGRAGHCYRAANEYRRATFAFFRAYELSIALRRFDLTKYFCAEGWKIILDRWVALPKVIGLSDEQLEVETFLLRLSGFDFQWLVWYLLNEQSFQVEVAKQTHDDGIDLRGTIGAGDDRRTVIVQCKNPRRRNKKVAASQIKELLGVHVIHRTDRLMFFTTTDFSAAALKTAKASCLDIELINRSQIFERLRNVYRLEVSSMDIVDRELEERTGILEAAKGSGMSTDLVNRSYEHQQRVSVPYYMNSQLNAWLISLGQRALADSRIGFVTLKAPDG